MKSREPNYYSHAKHGQVPGLLTKWVETGGIDRFSMKSLLVWTDAESKRMKDLQLFPTI